MNCVPWCLSAIALLCSQTLYICEHNSSRLLLSWTRFSTLITNQWFSIWTWFEAQFGIEPKNLCVVQFYPRGEFSTTANVTAWTPSFLPLGINFSASTTRTTFWQQKTLVMMKDPMKGHSPKVNTTTEGMFCNSLGVNFLPFKLCFFLRWSYILVHT